MYSFIVVKTLHNMNARVDEDGVWECGHVKIRFKPFKRICYFGHSNPLLIDWLIDWLKSQLQQTAVQACTSLLCKLLLMRLARSRTCEHVLTHARLEIAIKTVVLVFIF